MTLRGARRRPLPCHLYQGRVGRNRPWSPDDDHELHVSRRDAGKYRLVRPGDPHRAVARNFDRGAHGCAPPSRERKPRAAMGPFSATAGRSTSSTSEPGPKARGAPREAQDRAALARPPSPPRTRGSRRDRAWAAPGRAPPPPPEIPARRAPRALCRADAGRSPARSPASAEPRGASRRTPLLRRVERPVRLERAPRLLRPARERLELGAVRLPQGALGQRLPPRIDEDIAPSLDLAGGLQDLVIGHERRSRGSTRRPSGSDATSSAISRSSLASRLRHA